MEIIKINKNAIKLILAPEESEKYEFITDSNATDEVMLSSLNLLLQSVKEKTSTDFLGKRLLVQVYYDKIGECEIYIASIGCKTGVGVHFDAGVSFDVGDEWFFL